MGLSKNHLKLITSLRQKKYRQKHKMFVVEGMKGVNEFLNSNFECYLLFSIDADFETKRDFHIISDVYKFIKNANISVVIGNAPQLR